MKNISILSIFKKCPDLLKIFLIANDPIVPEIIKEKVKGSVEIAWFNDSNNSMTLDVQGKEMAKKFQRFL